jgi:hypothetical protein
MFFFIKRRELAGYWPMPAIVATWEAEMGNIVVRGLPRQVVLETPISKITRVKWARGVTQAVEHLLCK